MRTLIVDDEPIARRGLRVLLERLPDVEVVAEARNVTDALQLDAAFDRYDMRGTDHVTPQSAYSRANIFTVGGRFTW